VHLARLAAFYQNCRSCAHRHDTGQLRKQVIERLDRMACREVRGSLLASDGIRGVYLNEFSRPDAERYAAAFAALVWESLPLTARTDYDDPATAVRQTSPAIVVGRDARASSPEITVGVAAALQRMGCRVIDIGVVNVACLWFAVAHLSAAGGVYVTGHGFGPAASGLDFVDGNAVPLSQGGSLDRVEALAQNPVTRPTRRAGSFTTFRADLPYRAGMLKHLQSLRPLRVGIACDAPLIPSLLVELFADLPCRVHRVAIDADRIQSSRSATPAILADAIREQQLNLGMHIADDGQACLVLDERGRTVPPAALAAAFVTSCGPPHAGIVVDDAIADSDSFRKPRTATRVLPVPGTRESITRAFNGLNASIGVDRRGRFWFADQHVTCDAVLTLAHLLQMLSSCGRPLSSLPDG
jgi:phosphomannomutase